MMRDIQKAIKQGLWVFYCGIILGLAVLVWWGVARAGP